MIVGGVVSVGAGVAVIWAPFPVAMMVTGLAMLPFALVWYWFARACLVVPPRAEGDRDSAAEGGALLLLLFAATSLLFLHPAAGLPHVLMAAPAAFPLLALPVRRRPTIVEPGRAAVRAVVAATVLAATLAPLCIWLWHVRRFQPPAEPGFDRASHVWVDDPAFRDGLRLTRSLDRPAWRGRDIFVPTGRSMLYFLSGRNSLFDQWEFIFYMVRFELIDPAYVHDVIESQTFLSTLREQQPLVIVETSRVAMRPFARTFTEAWTSLERETFEVERVGRFVVRDWRARQP